jgi:hypothetical protein
MSNNKEVMVKDRETNFKEHSIFLSEIATNILKGNDMCLSVPGVREIIALYLLIPYITPTQLDAGMKSKIPQLDLSDQFTKGVDLKNLRDALCHFFVSVEESTENRIGRLIFDDRAQMTGKDHNVQVKKSGAICIDVQQARERLLELHNNVINFS